MKRRSQRHIKVKYESKIKINTNDITNKRRKHDFMNTNNSTNAYNIKNKNITIKSPLDWQNAWDAISNQRKKVEAPVDVMGCHTLADNNVDAKHQRFQTLISLMLSSQTKDQMTAKAMSQLKAYWKDSLTVQNVLKSDEKTLDSLISVVGFKNKKVQYMKRTAEILHKEYNDDIPQDIDGLLRLPGIGPKMAYLCIDAAWGKCIGIGVDVHVHRIANRLGWVKTKKPEETRIQLEEWLPRSYWSKINPLLVGHGQITCGAKPSCTSCEAKIFCKYGKRQGSKKSKK